LFTDAKLKIAEDEKRKRIKIVFQRKVNMIVSVSASNCMQSTLSV
jgi:hypothetical protein